MDARRDELIGLAPTRLQRHRRTRYKGDEIAVPLAVFDPEDRATVVALYTFLGEILRVASSEEALRGPQPLLEMTKTQGLADLVARVKKLGRAPQGAAPKDVVHDIRGGAFNALFLQISRVESGSFRRAWIASIAFLARDHRKMMRSLVADLDPEARARDLETIPHRLTTLVEALREFPAEVGGRRLDVDVTVDGPLDPTIAESCVECGAIDRIAYNLLNNAVRHAEPPRVWVSFLSVGDDLRVVVQNRVSSADREALEATLSPDARLLFGAFSTTGSGQGLQIVTYLVGSAYGVPDSSELLRGGYVGARLRGGLFTTWFHWPLSGA